jgi:hypothetical protein
MYIYRLHYLADQDDGDPKPFESPAPIRPGDVIQLPNTGYFHQVIRRLEKKTDTRLYLSKSAQSESEAKLLAEQYEHWPEA